MRSLTLFSGEKVWCFAHLSSAQSCAKIKVDTVNVFTVDVHQCASQLSVLTTSIVPLLREGHSGVLGSARTDHQNESFGLEKRVREG